MRSPQHILLPLLASSATALNAQCPARSSNASLAYRMVDSNIQRSQGAGLTSAATGFIQLGLFQQALRAAIATTDSSSSQKAQWTDYLEQGILSSASDFLNVTADVERPLDRFSLATSYTLHEERNHSNSTILAAISALEQSAVLQPRNADGSLWYYDNVANLSLYHNLSYLDGMFSYAPFAILASHYNSTNISALGAEAAWQQVKILHDITRKPSGLLVHGFDASKAHNWSNPITGASPEVWGRSLAWYTLGLLNSLGYLPQHSTWYGKFKTLLADVLVPQIEAAETSYNKTGKYGVWQVVDRPGEAGNFVEASASCLTAYSLLHARRVGVFDCSTTAARARTVALSIYNNVLSSFLTTATNGTLDLSGTSTVASLSPENVGYEYYITRPVATNDVLGTSAFILASLEVERLCQ